jgi:hypothetical protein
MTAPMSNAFETRGLAVATNGEQSDWNYRQHQQSVVLREIAVAERTQRVEVKPITVLFEASGRSR